MNVIDLFALSGYDFSQNSSDIVRLGDIVNVIDRSFLYTYLVTTHIISREVDLLDIGSTVIELGNFVKTIVSTTSNLSGFAGSTGSAMKMSNDIAQLQNNVTVLGGEVVLAQTAMIGTARIEDASITSAKIVDAAITTAKIGDAQITSAKIANLAVGFAHIQDAAIGTSKIGDAQITSAKIGNLAVGSAHIQNTAIGTAQVADAAITNAKIGNLAVGTGHIANAAITNAKIASAAVGTANIIDANITTAKIAEAAITSAKIDTAAIGTAHIGDATITNAKIDRASANKLVVTTADIANAAIGTAKIATGAITNALIGTGAVQTAQIADGSITDAKVVGLTASKITAGTIDAGVITVNNLNANNITTGTINGQYIAGGAIDTTKLTTALNTTINAALANASTAQTTADGKNTVFYAITAPSTTGRKVGDTWFDTDDGNKMYQWNGTAWTATQFGTSAIANASITNALIADATIQSAKIASLDAGKITTGTLLAGVIGAGVITSDKIATGAINTSLISTNAVTATQISANTITGDKLVVDAITAREIASKTITANEIVANTITASEIASGTITATQIASNTITVNQLASNVGSGLDISSNTSITLKADKTYVDGMQIGGRNFFLNSEFLQPLSTIIKPLTTAPWVARGNYTGSIDTSNKYKDKNTFKVNAPIVGVSGTHEVLVWTALRNMGNATNVKATMYLKSTNGSLMTYRLGGGIANVANKTVQLTANTWTRVEIDLITSGTQTTDIAVVFWLDKIDTLWVGLPMLEVATKASEWLPAPEDMQGQMDSANSSITLLNNNITLKVDTSTYNSYTSTNDSNIASLDSRLDSAELKITDTAIVSTVRSSSSYTNDLSGKANQTSLDTTNANVTTAQTTANTANSTANTLRDTTVPALTTRMTTAESSIIQHTTDISLKVSTSDYTGNTVASLINQSATTVAISASKIDLNGSVTISDLDSSTSTMLDNGLSAYSTVNLNKSNWDRAANINSDGTFNTSKLNGTVSDSQVASASNWNSTKILVDSWKSGTTYINGGMVATNTIFAQQIAISDFTNLCQINEEKNTNGYATAVVNNLKYFKVGSGGYASIVFAKNTYVDFKVNDEYYVAWNGYRDSGVTSMYLVMRYMYTDGTWANAGSISMYPTTYDSRISVNLKITTAIDTTKTLSYVQLFLQKDGTSGNGYYYIRNIEFRKRYTGELIVDGSLTADKILGGTLTLGGSTNTKGVFSLQNTSGTEVVKMDNTGLTIKNGSINIQNNSGTTQLSADASGNLTFQGKLTATIASNSNSLTIDSNGIALYNSTKGVTYSIRGDRFGTTTYGTNYIDYNSATGTITSDTDFSQGTYSYGKVVTQWFSLSLPALAVNDVASFDSLAVTDPTLKDLRFITFATASTTSQELYPTIVNWATTGSGCVQTVNIRVRNISGIAQATRTIRVCAMFIGLQ